MISSSNHNSRHYLTHLIGFLPLLGVNSIYNGHTLLIEVLVGSSVYLSWIYMMGPGGLSRLASGSVPHVYGTERFCQHCLSEGLHTEAMSRHSCYSGTRCWHLHSKDGVYGQHAHRIAQ